MAKRLSRRYRNARWFSIACFVAGAACAAVSVLWRENVALVAEAMQRG